MTIQSPETRTTLIPADTSDNFLQRAVDRLEQSGSNSKIRLFLFMIQEILL